MAKVKVLRGWRWIGVMLLSLAIAAVFSLGVSGEALADAGDYTRDEAVAYLNSLVGEECCWNDSTTDCVDVAQYYYNWLGVGARSGNGCAYHTGNLPEGWRRVYSDPEPGDVAAWGADWGSSGYGHVACVVDVDGGTVTVVEQSTTKRKKAGRNVPCYYATYSVGSPYSYLRPNFRSNNHDPVGHIEHISALAGVVYLKGWAYDPDDPGASIGIHVWNGQTAAMAGFDADLPRQDINDALGIPGNHGFEVAITTGLSGSQSVDVYGINLGEGSNALLDGGHHIVDIPFDTAPPVISDIQVIDISTAGYTVSCVVTDNVDVRRVTFPTWTVSGGQDDLLPGREGDDGYNGVRDGDRWTFRVRVSDHNGEAGAYDTHVYAWDRAGNWCSVAVPTVDVPSDQAPDLSPDGWVDLGGGRKGYRRDGQLVKGWMDLGGAKYWFDSDGVMATGWLDLGSSKFYFQPDGKMSVGWTDVVVNGKTMHYYFNPASGNLVRGTWFEIDGAKYYFRPSGNVAHGWATISDNGTDKKYYFDDDYHLVTGWRDIDNGQGQVNHYYFRPSGSMATGWATIDGRKYWFRPSGNMATGFTTVDDAYKRYFDKQGQMLVGWQQIDGKTFYFRASGAMQTGRATIDGKAYEFTASGTLKSGIVPAQSDEEVVELA